METRIFKRKITNFRIELEEQFWFDQKLCFEGFLMISMVWEVGVPSGGSRMIGDGGKIVRKMDRSP